MNTTHQKPVNSARIIQERWLNRAFTPAFSDVAKLSHPVAAEYFKEHAEAKDGVIKACYAWHDDIAAPYRHEFVDAEEPDANTHLLPAFKALKERDSACLLCGRSRGEVRHDNLPAHCTVAEVSNTATGVHRFGGSAPWAKCVHCDQSREDLGDWIQSVPGGYGYKKCSEFRPVDITGVLRDEEVKFMKLLARAEKEVPKIVAKRGMSGDTLAVLHHTYGYDPETVGSLVYVSLQDMADYHAEMERLKAVALADTLAKRKVVVVQINENNNAR